MAAVKFVNFRQLHVLRNMFTYPKAFRDESVVDDYFGVKVADPYRWLENPDDERTRVFIHQQNSLSIPYIRSCKFVGKIRKVIVDLWDYPKLSTPLLKGGRIFQIKNSGLENQGVVYVKKDLKSEGDVFINPNELAADGTVALQNFVVSENAEIVAYSLSFKGSDWTEIRFKNVVTGKDYDDVLRKCKFSSMSWMHDNEGFFYGAYLDQTGKVDGSETIAISHQKLYYHKLGTNQSEDVVVVEFEDPQFVVGAKVSHCGNYLIVTPSKESKNNLLYCAHIPSTVKAKLQLIPIVTDFVADFHYLTNDVSNFVFVTDKNASNGKIVKIDLQNCGEESWETLIPEREKQVIVWAKVVDDDKLLICYMKDVKHSLEVLNLNTGEKLHEFPTNMDHIEQATGHRDSSVMFYSSTSFTKPKTIHRVDFSDQSIESEIVQEVKLNVEGYQDDLEVKQVFYKTKDASLIPMFVLHRKDLVLDGSNPCILYGYGGFNISLTPNFSLTRLIFAKHFNGIYAVANIRGGGEYGRKWHNAGILENKENCFDDFRYAAKYLIGLKYTCAEKLIIEGGSNGGLLVATCMNQSPELFGAVIAHVGVMDLLRFHKFTIGYAWKSDYGSSEDPKMFQHLYKYSPLHNVKTTQYPATLLLTADHDDRVVPLHSLKFIAELQHKAGSLEQQTKPLLIKVDTRAGHGAGRPTNKKIDQVADVLCFISKSLCIPFNE